MNILTLNVGSSSIKYSLYSGTKIIFKENYEDITTTKQRNNAIKKILNTLKNKKIKVDAVAHRVVHGKDIKKSKIITKELVKKLKKIAELAPLHEIPEIDVIETCLKHFKVLQVAVFDTSFYTTLPDKATIYGLPYKYFKDGIKKYGFHGISHKYLSKGLKRKVITCHLGNGCSISAINNGKCIDTSMGFTPLEGLVMATRSGNLDPAIIPYMIKHEKLPLNKISDVLNNKSGLLGISEKSYDLRVLLKDTSEKSKLAVEVFVDRIIKQIGSYVALMNGVNTIVFSAGIGEKNSYIRKLILSNLTFLGIKIDEKENKKNAKIISQKNSKVKILVIPTNEELEMVSEVKEILKK